MDIYVISQVMKMHLENIFDKKTVKSQFLHIQMVVVSNSQLHWLTLDSENMILNVFCISCIRKHCLTVFTFSCITFAKKILKYY